MINFTTGPVGVLPAVASAFAMPAISHRSHEFITMHRAATALISQAYNVTESFILSGSGTLANEIMIAQIALRKEKGVILSNGEFGNRLINQAQRHNLCFDSISMATGGCIDITLLEHAISKQEVKWVLLCHCESSTGVTNPLGEVTELCKQNACDVYVDCMSTFGSMPIDLQDVAMATASSGKGIGAFAGLAIILSNKETLAGPSMPVYLDLFHAKQANGVPFTISSNLVTALLEAIKHNLHAKRWKDLDHLSHLIFNELKPISLIPFANNGDRIFTMALQNQKSSELALQFQKMDFQLSYQSEYLIKNNWIQLALFGTYGIQDIEHFLSAWHEIYDQK